MKTKEKKFDWVIHVLKPHTSYDPQNMGCWTATLISRQLPSVFVDFIFWGSPKGLSDTTRSQAEAFALAVISTPRSLESLSRIGLGTRTQEHAADILGVEGD